MSRSHPQTRRPRCPTAVERAETRQVGVWHDSVVPHEVGNSAEAGSQNYHRPGLHRPRRPNTVARRLVRIARVPLHVSSHSCLTGAYFRTCSAARTPVTSFVNRG